MTRRYSVEELLDLAKNRCCQTADDRHQTAQILARLFRLDGARLEHALTRGEDNVNPAHDAEKGTA